ncbi:MAG: hypothetical protein ACJA2G_001625 [Cognaticolwellia sp.]|jgi:hypothetical protein
MSNRMLDQLLLIPNVLLIKKLYLRMYVSITTSALTVEQVSKNVSSKH